MEPLLVLDTAYIIPVIIYLTGKIQTGTQTSFAVSFIAIIGVLLVFVMITDFPGNLNIIGFLFQSRNANVQLFQFVCEFSSQFVNVGAFGHGSCNDLRHFITGHQTVAAEGVVAITFDDAGSCQFADAVISPVTGRYIGERVGSIGRSGYAQCHSHCQY